MKSMSGVHPVTRIEYYRRLAGVSQCVLGERIGATRSLIAQLETGRRAVGESHRLRIADALQIDPKLLEEDPDSFPASPTRPSETGIESRVRKNRKTRGWSQGKLAARTGMSVKRIASIESGKERATLEEALVLAEAFDCDVGDLFSRKERGPIKGTKTADALAGLVGKRFGYLTVREIMALGDAFKKGRYAVCRCDCGTLCHVRVDHLKSGHTTSCGCQAGKRKGRKRHG